MSIVMQSIVDGHVRFKDRDALEALRDHRCRLRQALHQRLGGPVDVGQSIRLFDEDLAVIESGLGQLRA